MKKLSSLGGIKDCNFLNLVVTLAHISQLVDNSLCIVKCPTQLSTRSLVVTNQLMYQVRFNLAIFESKDHSILLTVLVVVELGMRREM